MPKHNSKRTDNRKYIILAIITVILIGSVTSFALFSSGGVFNSQTQQSEASPQPTPLQTPDTQDLSDISDTHYLTLEDWGVKFEIPNGVGELKYYKDGNFYSFTTSRVEALGDLCVSPNDQGVGAVRLAAIGRTMEPDWNIEENPPLGDRVIGGYYYYIIGSQSLCSSKGADIQTADKKLIESIFKTIRETH